MTDNYFEGIQNQVTAFPLFQFQAESVLIRNNTFKNVTVSSGAQIVTYQAEIQDISFTQMQGASFVQGSTFALF